MNNPDQIYFSGDYATWDEALKECELHPTEPVREKVLAATLKIRDNEAVQQGVFAGRSSCNFALITALLSTAVRSKNRLSVLDFGGSLGISYFHSRAFLRDIPEIVWSIVELPELVALGEKHFASEELSFYDSIENYLVDQTADIVVLSGVLQYLPDPWGILRKLLQLRTPFLLVDRTALINSDFDRLTIQHVPQRIYRIDHPVWFLSEFKLLTAIAEEGYECLCDFPAIDHYTLPGAKISFKGFICRFSS